MSSRTLPKIAATALVLLLMATACGSTKPSADATTTVERSDATGTTIAPEPLKQLRIYHPETLAFAAPFSLITDDGPLSTVADEITTDTWTTPDMLRGLLSGDKTDITAVPTYVGANLANKGVDVKMAAVLVWGLLWVLGPDGTPADDWNTLKGQTVMVPFQNDMPDLVFRYLAEANGLTPGKDFTIEYYATPPEAVARLLTGKGAWAVLPEHVATMAITKAGDAGHPLTRAFDLQKAWAKATGGEARIPQAGIVVPTRIAERTDVMTALFDELDANVKAINTADDTTVTKLAESSGLPAAMIKSLIPRLNIEVVSGADARKELERFYTELAEFNPAIIGGKLPDADFYLADPR